MTASPKGTFWRFAAVAGATLLCALATVGLGTLAAAAPAATPIYVRTDGDDTYCEGKVDAPHSVEVQPNCAVRTIGHGISLVTAGGTVVVGDGTYSENVTIDRDLALQGAGADSTTIDGGTTDRAVYVNAAIDVTISGVTIRNGSAAAPGGGGIYLAGSNTFTLADSAVTNNVACTGCSGGGLYAMTGSTTVISNCSFIDNTVGGSSSTGGAVRNWMDPLTVVASTFTGNTAGEQGGAIFSGGTGNSLTVIDSIFSDNHVAGATLGRGGAIYGNVSTLAISSTTIVSNTSSYAGGGISLVAGSAHIHGSLIAGNSAISGTDTCYGGGIHHFNTTLVIRDSVLRDNWVAGPSSTGGGLYNDGSTTLERVTVSGNSASYRGGGIYSQDLLTMTNVTVSGNSAPNNGGGVNQSVAVATIVHCTVASNTLTAVSPVGAGGLHLYSSAGITNTILAGNDNANCHVGGIGSLDSGGTNLEDADSCGLSAKGDITSTNPLLGSLAAYGGPLVGAPGTREPMRLHDLRRGSPAIDQANNVPCLAVDQRGVARPIDGDGLAGTVCDIGAYEYDLVNYVHLPFVLRDH